MKIPFIFYRLPVKELKYKKTSGWSLEINQDDLSSTLRVLRCHSDSEYTSLIDIIVTDMLNLDKKGRYKVTYCLLSYRYQRRLFVTVYVNDVNALESVVRLYSSANWYEREVWDIFGLTFNNHPDLRRLLTDYGFEGHPIQKNYPLSGFKEIFYNEEQKRVMYVPLSFTQGFRRFNFIGVWSLEQFLLS